MDIHHFLPSDLPVMEAQTSCELKGQGGRWLNLQVRPAGGAPEAGHQLRQRKADESGSLVPLCCVGASPVPFFLRQCPD